MDALVEFPKLLHPTRARLPFVTFAASPRLDMVRPGVKSTMCF